MKFKLLFFVFIVFEVGLFAGDLDTTSSKNTSKPEPLKGKQTTLEKEDEGWKSVYEEDEDLDKEFFVYYQNLNQPKESKSEKVKLLLSNLIKAFKSEIKLRDSPNCLSLLPDINAGTVRYKTVTKDSVWMKRVRREVGLIQYTEFMFLIKYKNYLALILYEVDPRKYTTNPAGIELIINKEPPVSRDE
ncbi:MAG: hypothetical protein N3A69_02440 [Leptospiraceae bacterium]|nr:hypothetical protein [Leptospiraceae bacterium]